MLNVREDALLEVARIAREAETAVRARMSAQQHGEAFTEETDDNETLSFYCGRRAA